MSKKAKSYIFCSMGDTSLKYFTQVLSVIQTFGLTQKECLNAVRLKEILKLDRVQSDLLADMLNCASHKLNDPQLGIKCALKHPVLQYTRPGEFLKLCENIMHAADLYSRYSPLFHTVGSSSGVISDDDCDRMIWIPNFDSKLTERYRQFVELIMTNYFTSINWLAWKVPQAVQQVNFRHKAVLPMRHYEELLGCDVKFDQEEYSVIFREQVKSAPFPTADSIGLANICMKFDKALNELYEDESLIDRVELQIRRSIEHKISNKTLTAKALNLSERSMTRALKNKGTSFKDIKSRVLRDLAVTKINQGKSLAETAQDLGYNDQAAFTRAYKKWFGYPPGKQNKPQP